MNKFEKTPFEQTESPLTQLKLTLPEGLIKAIDSFVKHFDGTKSEFAKFAFAKFLNENEFWQARRYFFKPSQTTQPKKEEIKNALRNNPKKGVLIKLALAPDDTPSLASLFICNLVRLDNEMISFNIPYNIERNTAMTNNLFLDQQNISLAREDSLLTIPKKDQYGIYIYSVPIDYIWDVDTATPQWILPNSL
ncbi:MAG: hypothetical protein ACRCWR_08480 [Saezia sp.]